MSNKTLTFFISKFRIEILKGVGKMRKVHAETLNELRDIVENGGLDKLRKNVRELEPAKQKNISFNPAAFFKKLIKKHV